MICMVSVFNKKFFLEYTWNLYHSLLTNEKNVRGLNPVETLNSKHQVFAKCVLLFRVLWWL